MSGQPWFDQGRALDLALAVFRDRERHADLLRGKGMLPGDVIDVISLALEAARDHDQGLKDENHKAALFFVEHVLLAEQSDHYRVLGLTRSCAPDDVREHFRLMMAVFHPDRSRWLVGDREDLAARINLAYQVLRNPGKRAEYDLELNRRERAHQDEIRAMARGAMRPAARVRNGDSVPPLPWLVLFPAFIQRRFPQFVLGSVALLGLAVILTVYLGRPAPGAIGMTADAGKQGGGAATQLRVPEPVTNQVSPVEAEDDSAPAHVHEEPVAGSVADDGLHVPATARMTTARADGAETGTDAQATQTEVNPPGAQAATSRMPKDSKDASWKLAGLDAVRPNVARDRNAGSAGKAAEATVVAAPIALAQVEQEVTVPPDVRGSGAVSGPKSVAQGDDVPRAESAVGQASVAARPEPSARNRSASQEASGSVVELPDRGQEKAPEFESAKDDASLPGRIVSEVSTQSDARASQASESIAEPNPMDEALPAKPSPGLTLAEAADALSRFSSAYQRGDLNAFMSLFAADARSNSGDVRAIRADYETLFRTTSARELQFHDVRWRVNGFLATAESGFVARVRQSRSSSDSLHVGTVRLEFVKAGETTLISGLFHQIAK